MMKRSTLSVVLSTLILSACGGGGSGVGVEKDGTSTSPETESGSPALPETPELPEVPEVSETPVSALTLPSAVATAYFHTLPAYTDISGELTFTAVSVPEWLNVDEQTGALSGTPATRGPVAVTVAASSDNGDERLFEGTLAVAAAEQYLGTDLIDFYAKDYDGNERLLRNDLTGDLAAEIQFVQSHSVAANGNYQVDSGDQTRSRYMPKLVAQREALLLFMPQDGSTPGSVSAELLVNGTVVETLQLQHPSTLLAPDNFAGTLAYSTKAWWAVVPWQHVRTGMSLNFTADEQSGSLNAGDIDVGEATQLVNLSIRVGMLTTPPAVSDGHFASNDPVEAAVDYFSTLPVSRVVMGNYADVQLDKVMVRSGVIYDEVSATEGSVYSGDMRENVGKSQVSVGINMANYGYSSWHMNQSYSQPFKQVTSHHTRGNYQNGQVSHGLSGGNGIATLYASSGNEASHEWGHGYGLGHYPGQGLTEDGRWAVHHADSGWGYIPFRQRLRTGVSGINADGSYSYNKDAMSGGWDGSPLSRYTHYTGYSARIIQNHLESFMIPDTAYSSGYKQWNTTTGEFEEAVTTHPAAREVGVAVATIIGAHNPATTEQADSAVIYPVFHGNYGNVFDLPAPDLNATEDACWLAISNADETKLISVADSRHASASANQLHVNLKADFRPLLAVLNCRRAGSVVEVTRTEFDGDIPALPPVGIVGMEEGVSQILAREVDEIAAGIDALTSDFSALSSTLAVKVASTERAALLAALPESTATRLANILQMADNARAVKVLLAHAADTGLSDEETALRLRAQLLASGLLVAGEEELAAGEIYGNNFFFDSSAGEGGQVLLTRQSTDNADSRSQWTMDGYGRLHVTDSPWLCLQPSGSVLAMELCSAENLAQRWSYNESTQALKNGSSGKCLDYDHANGRLISWGCSGSWNQRWQGVTTSDQQWLTLLSASELETVTRLIF